LHALVWHDPASIASRANVRGDRETPLFFGRETREQMPVICPTAQPTRLRHIGTTGKSRRLLKRPCQALIVIPATRNAHRRSRFAQLTSAANDDTAPELSHSRRVFTAEIESSPMHSIRWLAVVPFLALLVGPFFVNRVSPSVLDLPFLLAWIVAWILLTSVIMAVIYAADPANREDEQ
jgi:hypothetical protein